MENEAMQELQAEVAALRIMTATLLVASANRAALREAMRKLGATEIRRQETEGADTRMTEKLQSFLDEILDQLG